MIKYLQSPGWAACKLQSLDKCWWSLCDGNRLHTGKTRLQSASLGTAGSREPAPAPALEVWGSWSPDWILRGSPGGIHPGGSPSQAACVRAAGRGCARCWSLTLCFRPCWQVEKSRKVSRKLLQRFLSSESPPESSFKQNLQMASNSWWLFNMLMSLNVWCWSCVRHEKKTLIWPLNSLMLWTEWWCEWVEHLNSLLKWISHFVHLHRSFTFLSNC